MSSSVKNRYIAKEAIPFIIFHLSLLGIFWTGISYKSFALCIGLYFVRMFAVTAGYHRYFSHKSYSTSRVFQFVLAFLAETAAQQGVIWWANHHRLHHRYSDTENDVHSPRHTGFWHSHLGWIFTERYVSRKYEMTKDWERFPELVLLDKHYYMPPLLLGVAVFLLAGWQGLFVGFVLSTVLVFHCTFFINSLTHIFGRQRYETEDDSRNNWLLALITLGEGWHNNHHYAPCSASQGHKWWEIDITYYVLKILESFGIIWNLRTATS